MMSEIAWYCDLKSEAFIRKETQSLSKFFKVLTLKIVHKQMKILKIKPVPKKLLASQVPVFFSYPLGVLLSFRKKTNK